MSNLPFTIRVTISVVYAIIVSTMLNVNHSSYSFATAMYFIIFLLSMISIKIGAFDL
jgi:uncharacterized membrane protein YjdF